MELILQSFLCHMRPRAKRSQADMLKLPAPLA